MTPAVDVVTVPDFDGPAAARFECLTLLFLSAWMAHRGGSRSWPLHLACIGEPPPSVRLLAAEAGALVTSHAPLSVGARRTTNKLRGFEVAGRTDRILLVDTDVLVVGDLEPLAALVGDGVGVGAATVNHFPEPTWRAIYRAVGLPYPGPTGTCWCADDRLAEFRGLSEQRRAMCRRMPPYFNSGVVLAPFGLDFGRVWMQHLRSIRPLFDGAAVLPNWGGGGTGDEHGLATAVEACRRREAAVVTLPWRYHARPVLLRSRVFAWGEVVLFHYHNAVKPYARRVSDLPRLSSRIPPERRAGLEDFYEYVDGLYRARIEPVTRGIRAS